MPIIKTENNRVAADLPGPDDTHVQVVWFGPSQDGLHRKQFEGPLLPIEQFDQAVAWARELADQMVHPLYVVPLTGIEALRSEQFQRGVASLTDQQRGRLRQHVVATLAAVMRDCDDPVVRSDAYEVLLQMKVVDA